MGVEEAQHTPERVVKAIDETFYGLERMRVLEDAIERRALIDEVRLRLGTQHNASRLQVSPTGRVSSTAAGAAARRSARAPLAWDVYRCKGVPPPSRRAASGDDSEGILRWLIEVRATQVRDSGEALPAVDSFRHPLGCWCGLWLIAAGSGAARCARPLLEFRGVPVSARVVQCVVAHG
jgi:hypothetical protein